MHFRRAARSREVALAVFLLALAGGVGLRALPGRSDPPPDIVLVVWDTCRGDRVGVVGYSLPTTPRLADIAAEGVTFRYCFTPSPWTPPAHASLFTGLLPSRHGLRERRGDRVRPGIPLLAETLAKAGYETVAAPANPLLTGTGLMTGFETVLPTTPGANRDLGDTVAARIEEWARGRRGRQGPRRPLFLFVNLMDCHLPLAPAPEDLTAVHGEEVAGSLPPEGPGVTTIEALDANLGLKAIGADRRRHLSLAYDGGVHAADRATGRILDLLRGEGILDDALLAVTGDHGECLGERGEFEHRMSMGEAVLRVPLVLRWPRHLPGGRVEDAQVRLQDLYATILDAARTPPPPGTGTDSASLALLPVAPRDAVAELESTTAMIPPLASRFPSLPADFLAPFHRTVLVFREAAHGPSKRKLVLTSTDGRGVVGAEDPAALYDLAADPGEDRNLLGGGAGADLVEETVRLRSKALQAIR